MSQPREFNKYFKEIFRNHSDQTKVAEVLEASKTFKEVLFSMNYVQLSSGAWAQTLDLRRELGSVIELLEKCQENYVEVERPEWTEVEERTYSTLLDYINTTPPVLSLLYDLNLLPEYVEKFSPEWCRMINVVTHMNWNALEAQKINPGEANA